MRGERVEMSDEASETGVIAGGGEDHVGLQARAVAQDGIAAVEWVDGADDGEPAGSGVSDKTLIDGDSDAAGAHALVRALGRDGQSVGGEVS